MKNKKKITVLFEPGIFCLLAGCQDQKNMATKDQDQSGSSFLTLEIPQEGPVIPRMRTLWDLHQPIIEKDIHSRMSDEEFVKKGQDINYEWTTLSWDTAAGETPYENEVTEVFMKVADLYKSARGRNCYSLEKREAMRMDTEKTSSLVEVVDERINKLQE